MIRITGKHRLMRTGVVAFAVFGVLSSGAILSSCNDTKQLENAKKQLVIDAMYAPDSTIRLAATRDLKGDNDRLAEVAIDGEFADSRRYAVVSMGNDVDSLIHVVHETKCKDSRTTSIEALGRMVTELTDPEALAILNTLGNENEVRASAKRIAELLKLRSDTGTEDLFSPNVLGKYIGTYSPSREKRQMDIGYYEKSRDVGALKYLATNSEYGDTRTAAAKAAENLSPGEVVGTNDQFDIKRFLECKGAPKPASEGGENAKPGFFSRVKNAWKHF